MSEPWAQLPGESNEAHARFLIYRNLGCGRSLRRAYWYYLKAYDGFTGGYERLSVPGAWIADSGAYFWVNRATAWDIRNLHAYGARIAVLHTQAVTMVARKCVRKVKSLEPGDAGWDDVIESLRAVSEYLSPEVVRGIKEKYGQRPGASVPGGGSAGGGVE